MTGSDCNIARGLAMTGSDCNIARGLAMTGSDCKAARSIAMTSSDCNVARSLAMTILAESPAMTYRGYSRVKPLNWCVPPPTNLKYSSPIPSGRLMSAVKVSQIFDPIGLITPRTGPSHFVRTSYLP